MDISTQTLFEILSDFADEEGEKRLFFSDERSYTAAQFLFEVKKTANLLLKFHIQKGDMVALRATRSIETAIFFFALQTIGAVTVLTDPHQSVNNLPKNLKLPIVAYITNETEGDDLSVKERWKIYNQSCGLFLYLSDFDENFVFITPDIDPFSPAVIIFTSGSTGGQKAVTLSQFNMVNHAYNYGYGGCYEKTDISAELLPLYHVFGLAVLLTALVHRYEVYFPTKVSPEMVAESIIRYKMTRLDGVPSLLLSVASYFSEHGLPSKTLRIGVIGGAPVSEQQFSFIENTLHLRLVPVYGMSECIGITGLPESADAQDRRLTVGEFLPFNEGCIMSDDGEQLGVDEMGEICVRSPACMLGYYENGQFTADNIDQDGWLHTGDLGMFNSKGYVLVTGRKKDIIIRNGNNLSSVDISKKLMTIEGVIDVLVVGISDEKTGEMPAALVVTNNKEVFLSSIKSVLNKQELPDKIKFTDHIPLTSSGKPDRMEAKKILMNYE